MQLARLTCFAAPVAEHVTALAVSGLNVNDKGALMLLSRRLFDQASGDLLATVGSTVFMRGDGGFGGRSEGAPKPHPVPMGRAPDVTFDIATRPEQALLYRLSGDLNPLHVDPAVATPAGFDRPILHGLCSYGIAGRAVLALLCGNEPARLKRLDLRFASPMFAGETDAGDGRDACPTAELRRARDKTRSSVASPTLVPVPCASTY